MPNDQAHLMTAPTNMNNEIIAPTPETDAKLIEMDMADLEFGHKFKELKVFTRELERERDEARKRQISEHIALEICIEERDELKCQLAAIATIAVVDWDAATVGKVEAILPHKEQAKYADRLRLLFQTIPDENKQLRKVCDELAQSLDSQVSVSIEKHKLKFSALTDYNNLPHVKEKEKENNEGRSEGPATHN